VRQVVKDGAQYPASPAESRGVSYPSIPSLFCRSRRQSRTAPHARLPSPTPPRFPPVTPSAVTIIPLTSVVLQATSRGGTPYIILSAAFLLPEALTTRSTAAKVATQLNHSINIADNPDPTRWSHTSGEEEAYQKGDAIEEGRVHISDETTRDILVASGGSTQNDRDQRRARREREAIEKLRREEEERAEKERQERESHERELAQMKRAVEERERQMREEKRKQDEK
jgi:hypothetical protein